MGGKEGIRDVRCDMVLLLYTFGVFVCVRHADIGRCRFTLCAFMYSLFYVNILLCNVRCLICQS